VEIAIPIYDRFTALDAIGPCEVVSRWPEAKVHFVADEPGIKRTDNDAVGLVAGAAYEDVPAPDVILVPGGFGTRALLEDERILNWLRTAHETSEWTTSVCTGSLLLGAAGILDGLEATTHWLELDTLAQFGAIPAGRRVVEQGKVITAAGVSSGIDMALTLTAKVFGPDFAQILQLGIEYDPQPPFDAGSPDKAPAELVELMRTNAAALIGD
jgi:transcriptional regulator GlxA family with amidase domain